MGVYGKEELKQIPLDGWLRMIVNHKKDIDKYYAMDEYPNKRRDIDETIDNIHILMSMVDEYHLWQEKTNVRF